MPCTDVDEVRPLCKWDIRVSRNKGKIVVEPVLSGSVRKSQEAFQGEAVLLKWSDSNAVT